MRPDGLLRAEIAAAIHRSVLPDLVWARAQQWSGYREAVEGRKPVSELTEYTAGLLAMLEQGQVFFGRRTQESLQRGSARQSRPTDDLRKERQRALAQVAAAEADGDPDVAEFRDRHLPGGLLDPHAVKDWIQSHAASEGESAQLLLVEAPRGTRLTESPDGITPSPAVVVDHAHPATERTFKVLCFPILRPDGARAAGGVVAVASDGVLARLREMDERLGARYGWPSGDGALFVLTGAMPVLEDIGSDVEERSPAAFSRLLLVVDPTSTPEQVAAHYKRLRRRYRTPSLKYLRLAAWLANRPDDESANARMAAWRQQCLAWGKAGKRDDWTYENPSNFNRDCRDAINRLLNPI